MTDLTVEKPKKIGRPHRLTAAQIERKAAQYHDRCLATDQVPTITGLALSLGYSGGRSTLTWLLNSDTTPPDILAAVKKAKNQVVEGIEQRLFSGGQAAGPIFWLKNNAGWTDKQEINQTVTINGDGLDGRLAAAMAARVIEGEVIEEDD